MKKSLLLIVISGLILGGCAGFSLPAQKHIVEIPGLAKSLKKHPVQSITERRYSCVKELVQIGVSQKRIAELCNSVYGELE